MYFQHNPLRPRGHSCRLHAKEPKFAFWCKVSLTNTLKVFLPWRIWIRYFLTVWSINGGVMDITIVLHVGDWGSITRWGAFILFFLFYPIFTHFGGFSDPQNGVTLLSYTYRTFSIQSEFKRTKTKINGILAFFWTSMEFQVKSWFY